MNHAIKIGIPPEKDDSKCTYCDYKKECELADKGEWKDPRKEVKTKGEKADKGKDKKNGSVERCGNCSKCKRDDFLRISTCKEGGEVVDRRKKCKFNPSKWETI